MKATARRAGVGERLMLACTILGLFAVFVQLLLIQASHGRMGIGLSNWRHRYAALGSRVIHMMRR